MTKIQRSNFLQQHGNKKIDLDKVEAQINADPAKKGDLDNAGISMDKLRGADRNRDGKLDAREAWKLADDYDHDGTRRSLIAVDRASGQQTQAGKAAGALGALLASKELQPDKPGNDDILIIGMNVDSKHEAAELRRNANGNVQYITDSKAGDGKIKVGDTVYDLAKDDGLQGFVDTLNLPKETGDKVFEALKSTRTNNWGGDNTDGLDEMAQLAQVWAKAERGEEIPSRLVLSGHQVGNGIYGDDNGQLTWGNLQKLSKALPAGAAAVEDLNISGCYSGGAGNLPKYKGIFPKVKTVWAYSGSAPGSWSGATAHQKYWERATRGGNTDLQPTVDKLVGWGTRKAHNIDVQKATAVPTYSGPPLAELRQAIADGEPLYQQYFTGQREVQDRQNGALRGYYNQIQGALQNPDLPASERSDLEGLRDQTIRRIFYDSNIRAPFNQEYGQQIAAGYQSLGLQAPDFSTLSRSEAMASIEQYRAAIDANPDAGPASQEALGILNGLWNLDPQYIPQVWI